MPAAIVVLFEPDPELEAAHRPTEHAPGRVACTCGWYPPPLPDGGRSDADRLLEHRRLESRRRVLIDRDYFLAWSDRFGTGQMIHHGDTGYRIRAVLDAHGTDATA